jgi:hypothetical protein
MNQLTDTRELRYRIQMCKSQDELDRIVKRNKSAIHEHSYMSFVIENTRRTIRHIETTHLACMTYLQN